MRSGLTLVLVPRFNHQKEKGSTMKSRLTLIVLAACAILVGVSAVQASTISSYISLNPNGVGNPPIVDNADIANVGGTEVDPSTINYNETQIWTDRPVQGQTFTTGSNPTGYSLDAITVQIASNTATYPNFGPFSLQVGTVSGTTLTPVATTTTSNYINASQGDYVCANLGSTVQLNPNTLYGFDWASPTYGGFNIAATVGTAYAGGSMYTDGANHVPNNSRLVVRHEL